MRLKIRVGNGISVGLSTSEIGVPFKNKIELILLDCQELKIEAHSSSLSW